MNGVEHIASWLTPTVLFCVLNLMIGTIYITSSLKPRRKPQNLGGDKDEPPPQLGRVPSIFERVTSFNLSRYQPEQQPDPAHYAVVPPQEQAAAHHQQDPDRESEEAHHDVTRSKSQPAEKVAAAATATAARKVLKKSASEKVMAAEKREEEEEEEEEEVDRRRPATAREMTAAEEAAVDDKADDFINRFRQQLKLQRLDSILRYKEMLNRGT